MFDIRPVKLSEVEHLFQKYHPYKGAGAVFSHIFAAFEDDKIVAAFAWKPPPPGAAKDVFPEAPQCVLSLARMVAVPKTERRMKHISKPLRQIMKQHLDRVRWPVLISYHDEALHTGHTYACAGWTKTSRKFSNKYLDESGARSSIYKAGRTTTEGLTKVEGSYIQRWEHWSCSKLEALDLFNTRWNRVALPGTWRSGQPKGAWVPRGL